MIKLQAHGIVETSSKAEFHEKNRAINLVGNKKIL